MRNKFRFPLLLAVMAAAFFSTAHAQMPVTQGIPCAQGLPCNSLPPHVLDQIYGTGGHAPGQVLPAPPPRGPGYMADSYAAIAFWQSATGQPGYSYSYLRSGSQESAEKLAITACESAGGVNCVIGLWGANGHFAISRDSAGNYYAGFADKLGKAKRSAQSTCRQYGKKCKVVETIESLPYYHEFF